MNEIADMVSVIVPIYNGEKYLGKCLDSIINQNYRNIEIILINDGSTDNSGEICKTYALGDDRIRVIHTQNSGPAAARNTGIKNSKGSFIFFLDADDFIANRALELLVENYNKYKSDIIIGDFIKIRDDESYPGLAAVFSGSRLLTKQDIADCTRRYLKKPNRFELFSYSWGRLFRASIIRNNNILFDADLHTYEDVAFNFDYLKYTEEIFFLGEPIYNHLVHDNYTSARTMLGNNPLKLFGYIQALVNIRAFLENCRSGADIAREVGHAYIYLTIIQLVRLCGQVNRGNKRKMYEVVHKIINGPGSRENLKFYSPSKGDSRVLPVLMKLRLVWPIILVCKYKAYKRYRKRR